MKCSKICFALAVLIIMTLNMVSPAFALSHSDRSSKEHHNSQKISFSEHLCDDGRTIRKYEKHGTQVSHKETKELLKDLGMRDHFIGNLSQESLTMYAQAESITSIVTYTRTDETGNVEVIDQQTALDAATTYSVGDNLINQEIGGLDGAGGNVVFGDFEDSYMEMCLMIVYMGDGLYHFSVDAIWLTTPFFRGWDSIGISATHINVENATRSGWFKYESVNTRTYFGTSETTETTNVITFSSDENNRGKSGYISNCSNGTWNGSGAIFSLPIDMNYIGEFSSEQTRHRNFSAHFEFDGTVDLPLQVINFSAVASYDHATLNLSIAPSVSIGASGIEAVVLDILGEHDTRVAELDHSIRYTP